jgi:hypothetical protein
MTALVRCDMCGQYRGYNDNCGWFGVSQQKEPSSHFEQMFPGSTSRHVAHLCSWDCLAKYASAAGLVGEASKETGAT